MAKQKLTYISLIEQAINSKRKAESEQAKCDFESAYNDYILSRTCLLELLGTITDEKLINELTAMLLQVRNSLKDLKVLTSEFNKDKVL